MLRFRNFYWLILLSLFSCDGIITMDYVLNNDTDDTLKVILPYVHYRLEKKIDSVNILFPDESMIVNMNEDIGFGWDVKSKIYEKHPFPDTFYVFRNSDKVDVKFNKNYWNYSWENSVYSID